MAKLNNFKVVCCFAKNPCEKCKPQPWKLDGDGGRVQWNAEDESWEDLCLCGKTQNQEDDETGDFIDGQWYCDECYNSCDRCVECECSLIDNRRSKDNLLMCYDCYDPEADKCPDMSDDEDDDDDDDDDEDNEDRQHVCFNCKNSKPANPLVKWNICLIGKCPDCETVCRDCHQPWSKDGEYVGKYWYCNECYTKPAECDRCGACDKQTELTYHGEILCQNCDTITCAKCSHEPNNYNR